MRRIRGTVSFLAILSVFVCMAPLAVAQAMTRFDVPAQPLADALRAVGSQAKINVLFDPTLVAGHKAPALKANLTIGQALTQLLVGTGIRHEFLNDTTVVLEAPLNTAPDVGGSSSLGVQTPASTDQDGKLVEGKPEEGKRRSPDRIRLAQVDQGRASLAAEQEPSTAGGGVEEVLVTATRQGAQSIQTVAMAISVVSPTQLDSKGLSGVSDFVNTLPSVNMQSQSPGVNSIEMRGLVTQFPDITLLQDRSLTSLYLDDAPISVQTANPDLKVFDLERIEVIRGPQGTLFGAGSMAGTIRLLTRKPDAGEFSGSGDISVSETQHGGTNYDVRGAVNLPLIDGVLAMRLNGYRGEDSGYIDNIQLGKNDANDVETTQGRAALRWTPTEKVTVDASATLAALDAHGSNDTYPSLGAYTYESLTPEGFDDNFKLFNVTGDGDLGYAHLIASVSYQDRAFTDSRSFQYFDEYFLSPGILLPTTGLQINTTRDATEEVRLVSNPDGLLRWTVGAFNENYHRNYLQIFDSPGSDTVFASLFGIPGYNSQTLYGTAAPDQTFWGPIDVKEHQLALFGEATYQVLPRLDVTLGARYFDFRQNFSLYFVGPFEGAQPLTQNNVAHSSGVNPRAVASYHVSDAVMLYTEAARGFRYGGSNLPVPEIYCGEVRMATMFRQSFQAMTPQERFGWSACTARSLSCTPSASSSSSPSSSPPTTRASASASP